MRPHPRRKPILFEVIHPLYARIALLGLILSAAGASAAPESLGSRQTPLAHSPEYGDIAFSDPGTGTGTMVVSTREGVEVRLATSPGGAPVGIYRAPGSVKGIAVRGTRAYLFQGDRGITALDLSDPSSPSITASIGTPSSVRMGAILSDGSCVAASDSFVHVYRLESGGELTLAQTLSYGDGRLIRRVRAQGDSILVVAARPGVLARLFVTVYRFPAGATSLTRLHEWISNAKGANDAVWSPPIAFIADGSAGIYTLNTATGVFKPTVLGGGFLVRALGVTPSDLFAVGEARSLQRFPRFGALGDSLPIAQTVETLDLEPVAVAADGPYAYVSTRDVVAPVDPDEVGRSQIEFPVSSSGSRAPIAPIGNVGRSRRIVIDKGLAYVADYTGGLRIYRAGGADTSIVGVLPPTTNGRPVDLALDTAQSRVYLASGAGGLEIVDVLDPAAPQRLASLTFPGLSVTAVTIVNPTTVAVARRGSVSGVAFVDVSIPTAPVERGSVNDPVNFVDPRALAARDTVLFVADHLTGVHSVGFGNPDAPEVFGLPSNSGARDLDLQGTILLVATRSRGLQVVDVFSPAVPILRSEVPLPPVLGVARNGSTAIACLGDEGVAVVDVSNPTAARLLSTVAAAGVPRDAAWAGDSLLIAGGTSIDRFLLAPSIPAMGGLSITLDPESALPRARLAWTVAATAGQVGWNLYREIIPATSASQTPGGSRIDGALIDPGAQSATDNGVVPGVENRYRLEAVFDDGRLLTVAEGSIVAPAESRLGRPYPNPFRSTDGEVTIPFQTTIAKATVTLAVVDVRGRSVQEISRPGPVSGGFGSIGWDGRDRNGHRVPGGVYYLCVRGAGIDDARAVVHIP